MARRGAKLQAMEAPSGVSGDGSGLSRVGCMPESEASVGNFLHNLLWFFENASQQQPVV
jgi:hypothetical protein